MLDRATIEKLRAGFRGDAIEPGHPEYESARRVYNAMIDRRPALIARCANVADVIRAVLFGREHDLLVAVRGGGHNGAGLGVCDDGLVIDLARLNGVRVDPVERTARVEGGCTLAAVDSATHAFGLAVPAGIISTTGVGGLTLGGGIGHLTRKYGLTIDNLLEADIVLADGRFMTVGPGREEDLYWAIRGGGGNFGIVTSFLFRLHPVRTVHAGPMLWPVEQATEVMEFYRDFIPHAPWELNGFFAFMVVPPGPPFPEALHGKPVCGIVWCYCGAPDDFNETFAPVRRFRPPALEMMGPMPYPAAQTMFDALLPPGLQWYWKANFVKTLSDEAVSRNVEHGSQLPTMLSTSHLYPIDGAVHQVSSTQTAWAYRDATWAQVIAGIDRDPANNERIVSWARAYWDAVHQYGAGGGYVNFMMEEGQEPVRASYGDNYARLAAVKRAYDPTNFFRVNQNIQPAGVRSSSLV